eukprot:scaffold160046_cov103-Attheya_sp.AAC.1
MVAQLVVELRKHGLAGDMSMQDIYTSRTIRKMSTRISGNLHDLSVLPLEDGLGSLQRLEKAFQALMRRHKVLCTKYFGDAGSTETAIGV